MTTFIPLTCPYCNAPATTPPGASTGQRILCNRCGETFSLRTTPAAFSPTIPASAAATAFMEGPAANLPAVPPAPHRPTPRRNRLVAVVVLGTMFLMATLSLTFALYTRAERRANDTAMKKRPGRGLFAAARPEPPPEPLSPWRLPLLGYLPPDTNIVLGLHVAELFHDKAGRQLLDQPLRIGRTSIRPGQIAGWCGLPLEDIDHIVLGISTRDPIIPPAVLLVRTNRPYLPEQVRNAVKGEHKPGSGKKQLYHFTLQNPMVDAVVWCIDGQTLALALIPAYLDAVPAEPRAGLDHLPQTVRATLKDRVESGALLWLVGGLDDRTWDLVTTLAPWVDRQRLASLRTVAAWVLPQDQVRVGAVFQSQDAAAARHIEDLFSKPGTTANPNLKVVRDGPWVTLQYRTDLEAVLQAMAR